MASPVPAALLRIDDESVDFLKQLKAARREKWKLTRVQLLYDASELMYYLLALNRPAEAAEIGDWVRAGVRFANDYEIWSAAALCFCGLYHARLRLGDPEGAMEAMEPLRKHGSHAGGSRWYLERLPEEEDKIRLVEEGLVGGVAYSRMLIRAALGTVLTLQAQRECGIGGEIEYPKQKVDALRERALGMYALLAEPKSYSVYVKGRQQPALPAASPFSSVGETNKALLKFKKEREGKWRFDTRTLIDDAVALACLLDALDRRVEARAVLKEVMASLAVQSIYEEKDLRIVYAYFAALDGDWDSARAALLPLIPHPHNFVPLHPEHLRDPWNYLNYVTGLLEGIRNKTTKGSAAKLRGYLLTTYPGVMDTWLRAKLRYPDTDWLPLPVIEAQLADCKNLLRDLL
ncbi:MAG: hypothetical protein JNK87_22515 [Bryobacterales bacterium]|nr:hypothetical protein [Bryobacterales bacterium]